jgi:hypothetical protein
MAWPPPGMNAGMQLPGGPPPISWTPEGGNIGYGVQSLIDQLRGSQGGAGGLAGYGTPTVPVSGGLAEDEIAALRNQAMSGGAAAPAAAADLAGGAGEVAGGVEGAGGAAGLLARLGMSSPLAGGVKGLMGNVPGALGYAVGGQLAGLANSKLGGFEGQYQGDVTGALKGAGTGAALGSFLGGPGAVIGGVAGGAYGALSGPISDLSAVNKYSKLVDQFLAVNRHMPQDMRADAKSAALQIHNADVPLAQKPQLLSQLIDQMRNAKQQNKATQAQAALPPEDARQLAIRAEMAAQMNKIGQSSVDTNNALAQAENNSIAQLDPRFAPIVANDAAQRQAFGHNVQNSLTAATYVQPQIDQMNAQLARLAQLQQSLSAQGGGQSIASLLAQQAGAKK